MFKKGKDKKYGKLVEYGKYYDLYEYEIVNDILIKTNVVLKDTFENILLVFNNIYINNYKNHVFTAWYILFNIKSEKYIRISLGFGKVHITSNDDIIYNHFFTLNKMITNIYHMRQNLKQCSKKQLLYHVDNYDYINKRKYFTKKNLLDNIMHKTILNLLEDYS